MNAVPHKMKNKAVDMCKRSSYKIWKEEQHTNYDPVTRRFSLAWLLALYKVVFTLHHRRHAGGR